jgi:cytochrome oxidase assembly protein ShyY1
VWQLLRTRRWISFTITALVAILAFGLLSYWQWQRALAEDRGAAAVESGSARPAEPLTALVEPDQDLPAELRWRTATATGEYDCAAGALVRNRPLDAMNGFLVVCPLRTDQGLLWVNRGWLQAPGPATADVAMPAAPTGEVTVTGRLRDSETAAQPAPTDLPPGQVKSLDTAYLTARAGATGPVYRPVLEATASTPADQTALRPLPLPPATSVQNYSYAGQWLLFAAIAVGGWWYFLRREAADEAERTAAEQLPVSR